MLPPGHIAAGFMTAELILRVIKPDVGSVAHNQLVWWGVFFSFAPDLDVFYSFIKEKSFTVRSPLENDHRKYLSHVPVLWMIAGLGFYFLGQTEFLKVFGLLLWAGSWSHFILDSIESGIMWLWPLSVKKFCFRKTEKLQIPEPGFWGYWMKFLKLYSKYVTFYLELFIIFSALVLIKILYF